MSALSFILQCFLAAEVQERQAMKWEVCTAYVRYCNSLNQDNIEPNFIPWA